MSSAAFNAIDTMAIAFTFLYVALLIFFIALSVVALIIFVKFLIILPDLSKALKIYLEKNSGINK